MARISRIQQEMNDKFEEPKQDNLNVDVVADNINKLTIEIDALIARVAELEAKTAPRKSGINRVEQFNGEVETVPDDNRGLKMTSEDKINSMRNAIKILPPNMIENGRHIKENIQAICGFVVDEDMMDGAYTGFSHNED